MIEFHLNDTPVQINSSEDTPLLWVIRDELQLMGTKFGCGKGLCGACTVLFNGTATRSCLLPISAVAGACITTIEGLENKHPLQEAWIAHQVAQCAYCQSGQILSAVSLLQQNPQPSTSEIKNAMSGNISRCGTYPRILSAINAVVEMNHSAVKAKP